MQLQLNFFGTSKEIELEKSVLESMNTLIK